MEVQGAQQWEVSQEQIREQLLQSIQEGQEAEALLGSKVLAGWFKAYQDNALTLLDSLPVGDFDGERKLILSIRIVRQLKKSLERYKENGEMSEKELSEFLELKKKGLLGRIFSDG